jgi:hypothetical protein
MQDWWRFSFLTRRRRRGKNHTSGSFFDDACPQTVFVCRAFRHFIMFFTSALYLCFCLTICISSSGSTPCTQGRRPPKQSKRFPLRVLRSATYHFKSFESLFCAYAGHPACLSCPASTLYFFLLRKRLG